MRGLAPRTLSRDCAVLPCPRVTVAPGVEREHAKRYIHTLTVQDEPGGIVAVPGGIDQFDAAFECEHGRLPSDRSEPCGCYTPGQERARPLHIRIPESRNPGIIPDPPTRRRRRAPAITPEEATEMLTPVADSPDAPYGLKADGSPRRKPGRPAKAVAAAAAPAQSRIPDPPAPEPDFIAEKRREIDGRLRELADEREVKSGLRDQLNATLHQLDEEAAKLRKLQEALS